MENVLILQGGGSLGAYECGVFKVLDKHGIRFDVVAGTSIGAVNASIIAANDEPSKVLEDFWIDVADKLTPALPYPFNALYSLSISSIFGNPKVFKPRWLSFDYSNLFPFLWTYLYDLEPLRDTLRNYIDLDRLNNSSIRLIITATDIQRAESVAFDNRRIRIDYDHILASASFPFYGIAWIKKDNRYFWDGSLMSNTPLREVIEASPREDKNVYMVNLFPRLQDVLPSNIFEVWHRARDIMHVDKTKHNVKISRIISKYLEVMKRMHDLLNNDNRFDEIEKDYHRLVVERGAIIRRIVRIERIENTHFLFEDADFSLASIMRLIKEGEKDAEKALRLY